MTRKQTQIQPLSRMRLPLDLRELKRPLQDVLTPYIKLRQLMPKEDTDSLAEETFGGFISIPYTALQKLAQVLGVER